MTRSTSPRSVKDTPKTDAKPGTNGTPPTDPDYAVISVESPESARETTGWTIQFTNGGVHHIRVKGGRGRISFSSNRSMGGGEVRVYRNESTKTFDAVFTNVTHVVSDRVETIPSKWGSGDRTLEPKFGGTPPGKEKVIDLDPGSLEWVFNPKPSKVKSRPKLNPEDF